MLRGLSNADEALGHLRMRNIQGELEPFLTSSDEVERVVRRNKMLLKSLQDHAREKVRWEALEEWEQARNNAVQYSDQLRSEASELVGETVNNEPGLEKRIETAIGSTDVTEKVTDGVIENVWRGILTGEPEGVHVWKGTSLVSKGRVELRFYKGDSEMKLDLNDEELAKEVLGICRQVVTNLQEVTILRDKTKTNLVQGLTDEVHQM